MISTNVMMSATIRPQSPTTSLTPPSAWHLQLSKSLDRAHRSIHGSIKSSVIGSVMPLESVFGSVEPSRLGVPASACGSVLESVLVSVLESVLSASLGAYSQAGWECAIEWDWECIESGLANTVKQAGSVPSSAIESLLRA
jgi:hypothetical protein